MKPSSLYRIHEIHDMLRATSVKIWSKVVLLLSLTAITASSQQVSDVEFLRLALQRLDEYITTFHDLSAQETADAWFYSSRGGIVSRTKVVSTLIIYQAQSDPNVSVEYRDVISVNGKQVRERNKRAADLLQGMTDAKSVAQELDRISKESNRFTHRAATVNNTLRPAIALTRECRDKFSYQFLREEEIDGIQTRAYRYMQTAPCSALEYKLNLPSAFDKELFTHDGTLWFDKENGRLVREERHVYAQHKHRTDWKPLVVSASFDFRPSPFGIYLPTHISYSAYRVADRWTTGSEQVRLTQDYGLFTKFEVTTQQHVIYPDTH